MVVPLPMDKISLLEAKLQKLRLSFDDRGYSEEYRQFSAVNTFQEWEREARTLTAPDKVRTALYYFFQPLYDGLIANSATDGSRTAALNLLDSVTKKSIFFLTDYYFGQVDKKTKTLQQFLEGAEKDIARCNSIPYTTKRRNLSDRGDLTSQHVHSFLKQFLDYVRNKAQPVPEYIVGCACGASEIAFALAGILEVDIGLVRYSKRRGDNAPHILDEHKSQIATKCKDKHVAVVEDYVCTGHSLWSVVKSVNQFSPASIMGYAVHQSTQDELLPQIRQTVRTSNFHVYTFSGGAHGMR